MYEEDQWLALYIILVLFAFISGVALLAARSQYRRNNPYEPWHARLAAAEGKPRHDGKERRTIISKTSTGWVSGVLLSVVALAAIAAGAIFFWSGWPDKTLILKLSATLRDIRAAQQQTTSGTKATNDSPAAEDQFIALEARLSALQNAVTRILRDNAELAERLKETQAQMAQDNASVAQQLKALTHRDDANAPTRSLRRAMAGVLAKDSEKSLRPQTPLSQPNPTPAIPKRRQDVMRNWF
jgi:hypothetical protein